MVIKYGAKFVLVINSFYNTTIKLNIQSVDVIRKKHISSLGCYV